MKRPLPVPRRGPNQTCPITDLLDQSRFAARVLPAPPKVRVQFPPTARSVIIRLMAAIAASGERPAMITGAMKFFELPSNRPVTDGGADAGSCATVFLVSSHPPDQPSGQITCVRAQ